MLDYLLATYNNYFGLTTNQLLAQKLANVKQANRDLHTKLQRMEDLLANRNASAVLVQSLTVSQHAIFRAKTRLKYAGSDDDIRRRIYKLTMRNLATMDSLPDGEYELDRNAVCRIKDNTVTTVLARRGSK